MIHSIKKIILPLLMTTAFISLQAQLIITDEENPDPDYPMTSVLLTFGDDANRGLILPQVATVNKQDQGGTFVYNSTDQSVQVWEGRNDSGAGGWTSLTEDGAGVNHTFVNPGNDITHGIIIGSDDAPGKEGVLILESDSKALVLPRLSKPHLKIKNPIAGTICYDTDVDMIAVYDGSKWYYWK